MEAVFFRVGDFFKDLTIVEVCKAVESVSGPSTCHGSQKLRQVWRVYMRTKESRVKLLAAGCLMLRGRRVETLGRNPFLLFDGNENVVATKLWISGVPISFSDEEIKKALNREGVKQISKMEMERVRDEGKLTNWVSGRRFVWIELPKKRLSKVLDMGLFKGFLFHKEMKEEEECGNCLKRGHSRRECKNDMICRKCKKAGHAMAVCPVGKLVASPDG